MPKNSLNVSLKGADDIFSTEESRQEQQREQVQQIPIGELFPFKNHPFKVLDDESMQRTVESVEQYGVLSPLIARPRPEGGYEIISGHRRQHAAQLAGLETLPVIVRQMDDDAAVLLMVDSTLENPMQLNKDKLITEKQKKEGLNTDSLPIHSPNPLPSDEDEAAAPPPERTENRKEAAYQIYRDLILENIEYDTLTQNPRIDREQLDEIVDILLETVCTSRKSIRVAGDDYPAELVKAKFLKLDSHHIEFVMDCLRDNTTKVRNIKQYLRAMLFNAPSTINSYYASLVAHDMAQPDWGRLPNT